MPPARGLLATLLLQAGRLVDFDALARRHARADLPGLAYGGVVREVLREADDPSVRRAIERAVWCCPPVVGMMAQDERLLFGHPRLEDPAEHLRARGYVKDAWDLWGAVRDTRQRLVREGGAVVIDLIDDPAWQPQT